MKEAVVIIVVAVGGYMAWKHYSAQRAEEAAAQPAPNAPAAPTANQHGENRATAFSGAAPE
jgi:cytochrome c-type biogenesis protein CcmH/NrfG